MKTIIIDSTSYDIPSETTAIRIVVWSKDEITSIEDVIELDISTLDNPDIFPWWMDEFKDNNRTIEFIGETFSTPTPRASVDVNAE